MGIEPSYHPHERFDLRYNNCMRNYSFKISKVNSTFLKDQDIFQALDQGEVIFLFIDNHS